MKQSEILKNRLNELEAEHNRQVEEIRANGGRGSAAYIKYDAAMSEYFELSRTLKEQIKIEERRELEVGDGCTIHLYSDAHACTVIKRTAKSITIQQDIATLDENFKPKFIAGGFAGHCINQNEQTYTYERDPNGSIITARWSDKHGAFMYLGKPITVGRREFYDYNF